MPFLTLQAPPSPPSTNFSTFDILLNGIALSNLSLDAQTSIIRITVDEDTELPSMFTIELTESNNSNDRWSDQPDLFEIGSAVKIYLGQQDKVDLLMVGEITGLEPRFSVSDPLSLIVRGYDRRHRLQRGRKTRSFVNQTDSAIATQIATEAGLTAKTIDSQVVHPYVLQANQTDLEFLQERAKQIHYEVVVEDKTLFFRPVGNANSAVFKLSLQDYLLEFCPCLSSMNQVNEVVVRSWDERQKQALLSQVDHTAIANMGGKKMQHS